MDLWLLRVPSGGTQSFKALQTCRRVGPINLGLFAWFKKLLVFFLKADVKIIMILLKNKLEALLLRGFRDKEYLFGKKP